VHVEVVDKVVRRGRRRKRIKGKEKVEKTFPGCEAEA
jgi:hypothetical protein